MLAPSAAPNRPTRAHRRWPLLPSLRVGRSALLALALAMLSACGATLARNARVGESETGAACWYGRQQHGGPTASGEPFNMYELTAAHRKLRMGSLVRVENLRNQRAVVVRINDRGPFTRGRIIDLSYAAAKRIDMLEAGVVPVRVLVMRVP